MTDPAQAVASSPSKRPLRAQNVVEQALDGELVLYDPATQRVHALNPTAAFVWLLCDGELTEEDIVAALVEQYPESREAIRSDVMEILSLFASEGLIESREPADE